MGGQFYPDSWICIKSGFSSLVAVVCQSIPGNPPTHDSDPVCYRWQRIWELSDFLITHLVSDSYLSVWITHWENAEWPNSTEWNSLFRASLSSIATPSTKCEFIKMMLDLVLEHHLGMHSFIWYLWVMFDKILAVIRNGLRQPVHAWTIPVAIATSLKVCSWEKGNWY